jgi:hypothetical protein
MDVEEDEEEQEEEEQEEELIVTGPRKAKSAAMCNISRSTVDKRKRGSSDDSDVSDFEDEDYEDEDYKDEDGRQTELQDDEDEDDEDDDPSHVERSVVGAYVAEPAVAEASTTEVADAVAETSNSDGDADDKKKQPRVRHKKKLYKVTKPYETSSASFVPATSEMTPQKEDDAMKYAVAAAPMRATVSLMEEENGKLKTDNCRTVATNPNPDTIPVVPVGVPIANPPIGHVAPGPSASVQVMPKTVSSEFDIEAYIPGYSFQLNKFWSGYYDSINVNGSPEAIAACKRNADTAKARITMGVGSVISSKLIGGNQFTMTLKDIINMDNNAVHVCVNQFHAPRDATKKQSMVCTDVTGAFRKYRNIMMV